MTRRHPPDRFDRTSMAVPCAPLKKPTFEDPRDRGRQEWYTGGMAGRRRATDRDHPRGFTLTELLVVIALIVLLVTLLLAALARVRGAGREVSTLATMSAFSSACETFVAEHGRLPGAFGEATIAFQNHQVIHGDAGVAMTSMEDAILGLMGGYVVQGDVAPHVYAAWGGTEIVVVRPDNTNGRMRMSLDRLGEGPVIDGQPYASYYTPTGGDVRILDGAVPQTGVMGRIERTLRRHANVSILFFRRDLRRS